MGTIFSIDSPKEIMLNILLMVVGSAICAVAINGIIIPLNFLTGGFTGFALNLHYFFPKVEVGTAYALINAPIFLLGYFYVGRRFFFYSLAGVTIFTLALSFIKVVIPVTEMVPAALLAGIILGAGLGIILRSQGSSGGVDILSIFLLKRFSIKVGSTVLALDVCVLTSGIFLVDLNMALYTLIQLFVTSRVINLVLSGLSQRKGITIVSEKWGEIQTMILEEINRGVTLIPAEGGYTGAPGKVMYTVMTFREVNILKQRIKKIDPKAFVVVTDTVEVMGSRIGNQPHWG